MAHQSYIKVMTSLVHDNCFIVYIKRRSLLFSQWSMFLFIIISLSVNISLFSSDVYFDIRVYTQWWCIILFIRNCLKGRYFLFRKYLRWWLSISGLCDAYLLVFDPKLADTIMSFNSIDYFALSVKDTLGCGYHGFIERPFYEVKTT